MSQGFERDFNLDSSIDDAIIDAAEITIATKEQIDDSKSRHPPYSSNSDRCRVGKPSGIQR
jgi:hypothetical protein